MCKGRNAIDNRKEINRRNPCVQRNPFKCVHDNWHMNHALECNRVRCAGTGTHVCHVCVGSSNCAMAGLAVAIAYYAYTAK